MARPEGTIDLDLMLCLSSEAGRTLAKQPAWADRFEAGMPDLTVWTVDDVGLLMVPADAQRFRWCRYFSDKVVLLMPDTRDDEAWQQAIEHEIYDGEPALPGTLDLTGGALVGFDAYEPRVVRATIDVMPGHYLVVPRHHGKRLRLLWIVERELFQFWQDA